MLLLKNQFIYHNTLMKLCIGLWQLTFPLWLRFNLLFHVIESKLSVIEFKLQTHISMNIMTLEQWKPV